MKVPSLPRFRRKRAAHKVILYGKPGCHLCDDARLLLEHLSVRTRITVEEVDIRDDPELFRAYDIRIPVLIIDGAVELEAPITEKVLRAALR